MRRLWVILIALALPAPARAQWSAAGVPVCTAPAPQRTLSMIADGSGGAIVAWQDERNSVTGSTDIYAQHLTATGWFDAAWSEQGVPVCTAPAKQWMPLLAGDGQGGAYLVWADYRTSLDANFGPLLYAQHLTASGAVAPGWPLNGMPISSRPVYDWTHFSVADDGQGGAFVSWLWLPSLAASLFGVEVQRLAAGGVAAGWPADGMTIVQQRNTDFTRVAAAGLGDCWVAWTDGVAQSDDLVPGIYLQRLGAAGAPAPGWPAGGRLVAGPDNGLWNTRGLLPDGRGGAFVVSDGASSEDTRLVGQHVDSTGSATWASVGIQLDAWPILSDLQLASDGAGGLFAAWSRGIYQNADAPTWEVEVFRQDANGAAAPGWTVPIAVCDTSGGQATPRMVADGAGGVLLVWRSLAASWPDYHILAQHLDDSGRVLPGWSHAGLSVSSSAARQSGPALVADGVGGCVLAFADNRNVATSAVDVYAQRLTSGGTVPVAAVAGAASASARLSVRPNPALHELRVEFVVPRAGGVTVQLFDAAGRLVVGRNLGILAAGPHAIRWDAVGRLAPGIYWIGLHHAAGSEIRRLAVLR